MIINNVKKIYDDTIQVPVVVRSDQGDWIPSFKLIETKVGKNVCYIDCSQNFRPNLNDYATTEIDSKIGYFEKNKLTIFWKSLIDYRSLKLINEKYNGKLRACWWKRRYCTYFNTNGTETWLHSVIMNNYEPGYVIHHINGIAVDNRYQNLHKLPKKEHDSINHPEFNERIEMFRNPEEYWEKRKELAINRFLAELFSIVTLDGQVDFIVEFAKENMRLILEILEIAKFYINLSSIKFKDSENRLNNSHLSDDYLDTYEIEKYLKNYGCKFDIKQMQLKLF